MSGHKNLPKENGNLGRKKKVLPSSILSVSVEPGLCVQPGTGRAVPGKLLFHATSYRIASRSSFKINKNKKTKRYSLICQYLFGNPPTKCPLSLSVSVLCLSFHSGRQREVWYFPSHFLPSFPPFPIFAYEKPPEKKESCFKAIGKLLPSIRKQNTDREILSTLAALPATALASIVPISLLNPRDPHQGTK